MPTVEETNHVFDEEVQRLTNAISSIEGHAFGPHLKFATIGYGNQLHHSCEGGWRECKGFRCLPGLREFAQELNDATAPVRQRYAEKLRQALADACTRLATDAVKPPTFR